MTDASSPACASAAWDLSGSTGAAAAALASGYSSYGDGRVTIRTDAGHVSIAYSSRRPDVETMIDDACRSYRGPTGGRGAEARARPRLEPRDLDDAALTSGIVSALASLAREPIDATITIDADGIATTRAHPGRRFDASIALAAAVTALHRWDAPSEVLVYAPRQFLPRRATTLLSCRKAAAERIILDVVVSHGSKTWTIPATTVQSWAVSSTSQTVRRDGVDERPCRRLRGHREGRPAEPVSPPSCRRTAHRRRDREQERAATDRDATAALSPGRSRSAQVPNLHRSPPWSRSH
jgi:hypothetical protein